MKVFQIVRGFCHYDATHLYANAVEAAKHYSSDTVWVDAPDYVFTSWGYDETKEGDERFIQPQPPEGWKYDPKTGTFYEDSEMPTEEGDINAMLVDHEMRLSLLELGMEGGDGLMLYRAAHCLIEGAKAEGLEEKVDLFYELGKLTETEYRDLIAMLHPDEKEV